MSAPVDTIVRNPMRADRLKLAETYRGYSDTELASLHAQMDSLTLEARDALVVEIDRRGLKRSRLSGLHASEQRREANLDRLEKTRRKKLAIYLLLGRNPKLTIALLAAAAVCVLLAMIFSHR